MPGSQANMLRLKQLWSLNVWHREQEDLLAAACQRHGTYPQFPTLSRGYMWNWQVLNGYFRTDQVDLISIAISDLYATSQNGSFRLLRAGQCSGKLDRVQNKPRLVSLYWLLTSPHGDKAERSWPKHSKWDKPPDELNEHTCTQICRNRPEVPSFRWNNSSNQNKSIWLRGSCTAPSSRIACLCTSLFLTETLNGFWPVSYDTEHHKLSRPCNPTLRTHQLAAMEQSAIWQGITCMFHTMFFISYKTSGRVLRETPVCR